MKIWFCDYNKTYNGGGKAFYTGTELSLITELQNRFHAIQLECALLWKQPSDALFGNYNSFDDKQFPPNSWKKMALKIWGVYNVNNIRHFPALSQLLQQYPDIISCYITKTEPGSIIKPHCGETNAHIRIHLGLQIPTTDATLCGIQVGDTIRAWKEGEAFGFNDALPHHVWNKTSQPRYIAIVDVIRPEFRHKRTYICARVIVSQLFFWAMSLLKAPGLHRTPVWFLNALTYLALPFAAFIMYINQLYFYRLAKS